MFCITNIAKAGVIAYDINTTDLSAEANFSQGIHTAQNTVDGIINESMWAVLGNTGNNNYILWSFNAGMTIVDSMQILNNFHYNTPHNLIHFSIDYTTDLAPTLSSTYQPLNIKSIAGFDANVINSEVQTTSVSNDYRLFFNDTAVTGIRLRAFPNSGNHRNQNFVLNEVSFTNRSTINVPEPTSIMLFIFALVVLFNLRFGEEFCNILTLKRE